MIKSDQKQTSTVWFGLIALSIALLFAIMGGCVHNENPPRTIEPVAASEPVDSAAIYRCDTCPFAVAYRQQSTGEVKNCATCPWVKVSQKTTHDKGDVPQATNLPVNPLHEQDAAQHGTTKLVVPPDTDRSELPAQPDGQPPAEGLVARRPKLVNAPTGGVDQ